MTSCPVMLASSYSFSFRASVLALGLVIATTIATTDIATARSTGATLDPDRYEEVPKAPPLARGNFSALPSRASLKDYAPRPGNQGEQGSCVGWATAYAARTVLAAKARHTRPAPSAAFSPAYVFNQIRGPGCDSGSLIDDALGLMTRQGVMPLSEFPYTDKKCSKVPTAREQEMAGKYRIGGRQRLFGPRDRNRHMPVRRALAAGHPVVIGMLLPQSFEHYISGVFRPSDAERRVMENGDWHNSQLFDGGHALTVVGYDDDGGWFEIQNSWGTDWGEHGYFRISYQDFDLFVLEGYEVLPPPPPKPRVEDMHVSVRFLDLQGKVIPASPNGWNWQLDRPLHSGGRFRVETTPGELTNLYVVGADSSGQYAELFPRSGRVSPTVSAKDTLLLPGPTEAYYTKLDDTVGADFYILLAAKRPLDIAQVIKTIRTSSAERLDLRLNEALGKRRVQTDYVKSARTGIVATAASGDQDVVALVVAIRHLAPDTSSVDRDPPVIVLTSPSRENFDAVSGSAYVVDTPQVTITGRAQDASAIAKLTVKGAYNVRYSTKGPFKADLDLPSGAGPHPVVLTASDAAGNTSTLRIKLTVRRL